jgi:hypothetical protein
MKNSRHGKREDGNVLFYVLIAVALLAALSYAVAQSGRGNGAGVSDEKVKLIATEILEYASVMSNAVAQLRLRDIKDTDLCFAAPEWGVASYNNPSCTDDATKIFHLRGGGVTWVNAPSGAMDATATPDNLWHIYGNNEVKDVGTTCADDECADLILVTDELRLNVCLKLNELMGVTNPSGAPPTDSLINTTRFIGTYSYAETLGNEAGEYLKGKTGGCFENTGSAKYTFYKVLVAR